MIDSHCHINDPIYASSSEQYVKESFDNGITSLVVVGYDLASSQLAVDIANKYDGVFAAVGIHPSDVKKAKNNDLKEIEKLIANPKVIAIGEIGLDYHWDKDENVQKEQIRYFELQIHLANKHKLPIMIHCRDAYGECLEVLKKHSPKYGGIMHCYAGSLEMVKDFAKFNLLFGFGGVVTFKNAIKVKDIVKNIDEKLFVLETDAPYLTPTPYRGELNHSKYLILIAKEIANLRSTSVEQVIASSDANFKRIFKI